MLELRPTCEQCNAPLPPHATTAMICTFECTFCRDCVEQVLDNVCPNCGGGFTPRPIRPRNDLRNGNNLANHPAATATTFAPVDKAAHRAFAAAIRDIAPEDR